MTEDRRATDRLPFFPRYYAKRCFLALLEQLVKHMLVLQDSTYYEIMGFLEAAAQFGKEIPVQVEHAIEQKETDAFGKPVKKTVATEARLLKRIFMVLFDGDSKPDDEFVTCLYR